MLRLFVPLLAAAALLTGCLPQSKNPIAPPSQTFADRRLEGVWEQKADDGSRSYFHMARRIDRGTPWLDVADVSHRDENKGLGFDGYTALSAKIGNERFLSFKNSRLTGSPTPAGTFSFARYDFTWRGDLRIWLLSEDALAEAVRAGQLHGKVKGSGFSLDVKLTDSSARLAEFFSSPENVHHFFNDKPMVLRRVR